MRNCGKEPEVAESTSEMTLVKSLGKGAYGFVDLFAYTNHDGSTLYHAVKTYNSQVWDTFTREFRILSELKGCPSIVQLSGDDALFQEFDYDGNRVHKMSMEYAAGGTLTSFIQRKKKLSDSTIKEFTRMILQGLVSIHSHGYVHCDLKPDNILLFPRNDSKTWDCDYEVKISDFGLTIKPGDLPDCWQVDSPFVGTPHYMSPESILDGLISVEKTLDLWSLGCIVLEMYTGKYPWKGLGLHEIGSLLKQGNAPEIPATVPCDARQFLDKCFAKKAKDRGSALELLLHPFLIGDHEGTDGLTGGGRRRLGLRVRKPPERFEDITKKPTKLKIVSSKATQFKRIVMKPLRLKIIPPRPPRPVCL